MKPTDEQIIEEAKNQCNQTGVESFSELARKINGVNSAYGIGFIDGAVWCRTECKCDKLHLEDIGVKEIARMQEYITNLENFLWRMSMMIEGKDDGKFILRFTESDSATDFATTKIYEFIKEHNHLLEEIENLFTESDDVDDIIYSYRQIEEKIKEHMEKKEKN